VDRNNVDFHGNWKMKTAANSVHMPLRGDKLIRSFNFKQPPASWDDFSVGRAKHFATLHFLALLFPTTSYAPVIGSNTARQRINMRHSTILLLFLTTSCHPLFCTWDNGYKQLTTEPKRENVIGQFKLVE